MNLSNLTVVLPLKISSIKIDALIRLLLNIIKLKRQGVHNIVVLDASKYKTPVALISRYFKIYQHHVPLLCDYTPAIVKNSILQVDLINEYILFLDIDVLVTTSFLEHINQDIKKKIRFNWYPVIFTNNSHSLLSMAKFSLVEEFRLNPSEIDQIGYTTGIQLFNFNFFHKLNGYCEKFKGYGCEDIEMLHRATAMDGLRSVESQTDDYYIDFRTKNISLLYGFRHFFYQLKSNHPESSMPIHFWHKRKNKSRYLTKRHENDKILLDEMINFDKKVQTKI